VNNIKFVEPHNIEKRSFEIISEEIGSLKLDSQEEPIIKRVIHTSADFDYLDNLCFSQNAISKAKAAIKNGATIVTDTNMALAGINKKTASKYKVEVKCFMAEEDVAKEAIERGETRATISMERAANIKGPIIMVIGNAPTALIKLYELIKDGKFKPEVIIGVPVGFVNVIEAKELIMTLDNMEYIVAKGRKGGSNIAAAICNALLYNI
jgi:precorrin-8X/cobalt-precorrin-8 methylmutase